MAQADRPMIQNSSPVPCSLSIYLDIDNISVCLFAPLHFGVGAAILAEPRNLTQPLKPKDLTDKMYVFLKTSKARLGRATNGWFSFFFYFSSGAQGLAHAIPVIS